MQSDLVIDAGAHRGEDSDFYLRLGYRVVAIEANPELCAALRSRFASEIAEGRFQLIEKAVSDRTGTISFYSNDEVSVWGTTCEDWAERNRELGTASREIKVEAVSAADVIAQVGTPYYLKIDIEGADMACLTGLRAATDRPAYVSIESNKTDWNALIAEFDLLEELGYTRFQVLNQKRHAPGTFRRLDGAPLHYRFEDAASGPFGNLLEGPWLTRDQALAKYRTIFMRYRLMGDNTRLEKVLRRIPVVRRVLGLVGWYDTHAALG